MAEAQVQRDTEKVLPGEDAIAIRKNATEAVVVRPTEFNGIALVDARVWIADAQGKPETPTKKGLCLRPETWRELLPVIEAMLPPKGPEDDSN